MGIDPSHFHLLNVADTCSVWNILSSKIFYIAADSAGCHFCCTGFVHYECFLKPRKDHLPQDIELKNRLNQEQKQGKFKVCHLDIADLQEVEILERRRKLGKGELSSIAFARRTNQALMTDDQKARALALEVMDNRFVQTTPHLFGWLFFHGHLSDNDKEKIIAEHKSLRRPLAEYLEQTYQMALEYRLMAAK
jgi:hypothetical protein